MGLESADEPQSARITIRTYQREDHKVVCELFRDGNLASYCRDGENEYMRDFIDRSLQNDLADIEAAYLAAGGHFWVASISSDNSNDGNATEQVIGCLGLQVGDDKRSKLRRLSIHTGFRRRGVAQKLVQRAEQWSSERGLDAVSLGTFGEMVPAIKLYEAMGYTRTKEEPWPRDPNVVVVHFEKKL